MNIDIRNVPVYYINLDSHSERKNNIEAMLSNAGFTNVHRFSAIKNDHPSLGCALSHKAILDKIIADGIDVPFLILEDDASILNNFNPEVVVPDNADAVYLGLTTSARMWNYTVLDMVVSNVDDEVFRIYNLLAAHAILYTNIEYVKFLARAIQTAIDVDGHQDIVRASTMKFFNIYAKNNAIFFQNDQDRRVDLQTSVPLKNMRLVEPNAVNLGFACNCQRHR